MWGIDLFCLLFYEVFCISSKYKVQLRFPCFWQIFEVINDLKTIWSIWNRDYWANDNFIGNKVSCVRYLGLIAKSAKFYLFVCVKSLMCNSIRDDSMLKNLKITYSSELIYFLVRATSLYKSLFWMSVSHLMCTFHWLRCQFLAGVLAFPIRGCMYWYCFSFLPNG